MKYIIKKNIIFVEKQDFNPKHILECGQIFSYEFVDNHYIVYSADKKAEIFEEANEYKILCSDVEYFKNFFDLNTDYSIIKKELSNFEILKKPIEFGSGIRILRNNKFEMLISFIISANNNIKRIQKIINSIKLACGTNMGGYIAFPTRDQMQNLSIEDFKKFGAGYRANYLYKVLRQVDEKTLESWDNLDTTSLKTKLIELSGVGPKVADCILLFGYNRQDVFPVDTWIEQMYNEYIDSNLHNRVQIRNNLVEMFDNLSGYAQQYLFYYQRSAEK